MTALRPRRVQEPGAFGHVALLVGGDSAEREVSLTGGRDVAAAFQRCGISHETFDGARALFQAIDAGRVDRVFNLMHGPGGEDGAIQGALQLLNVPVTGSDVLGSALTMDKIRSKQLWAQTGIPTAPFLVIGPEETSFHTVFEAFTAPVFVKPTGLGSSIGVSRVMTAADLPAAVALARQHSATVVVEQGITGGEYFVGILNGEALPLIRIETPHEFYDYAAKYESDTTRYYCPCGLPAEQEAQLSRLALEAFTALQASGWGRVDLILDADGTPWFLEVNTAPGMTDHSLVPQAAAELGVGFDELVWRILETSL